MIAADSRGDASRKALIETAGGTIYARIDGDLRGAALPVLMIHGGPGGNHAAFLPALPLAENRAVVLYDQIDCGLSDKPDDPANWTMERFTGEVSAIGDALGIGRWHILGHSWGASIALSYAAANPMAVASLILQGPLVSSPLWMEDAAALRSTLPADVQATLDACESPNPPAEHLCKDAIALFYDHFWRLHPIPRWMQDYERRHGLELAENVYRTLWGPTEFQATGTFAAMDLTPLLPMLACPTLFLIGDKDEVLPETARHLAAMARDARVHIVSGAGHRIQSDQEEAWRGILAAWFREHDAA